VDFVTAVDILQALLSPVCEVIDIEISSKDLDTCLEVLQRIADSQGAFRRSDRFNGLISKIYREGKRRDLAAERQRQRAEDQALKSATAMVQIQRDATPAAAALPPVRFARLADAQ
jgi:hypothetical protein